MSLQIVRAAKPTGFVLNIQHFCTHDGPGIRTNVFLKGCSLRCKWCSNPESIHPKPELAYKPQACMGEAQCGFCLKNVCPESAIYVVGSGEGAEDKVRINWDLCTNCGKCTEACPSKALYLFGQEMTPDQVLDEVEQKGVMFEERLSGHPMISAIRRTGLALGLDLADPQKRSAFTKASLSNGVVIDWYLFRPATFRIAPPLTITTGEIGEACSKVLRALEEVAG